MRASFLRLLQLLQPFKWWMLFAALIGFLTIGSSVGLLMTSAYIIAKAALHPSVAELQVAIVGVRFFGIARGLFRYIERLISHEVTFRLLAKFRVWFYKAVEPLAPAGMMRFTSGDLLSRLVGDIDSLQNFYVRVISPPFTAILVSILMWLLFGSFSWTLALLLFLFMTLAGVGVPLLTHFLSRRFDDQVLVAQADMSTQAVELVQGMSDLLVYGRAEFKQQELWQSSDKLLALKRKISMIHALHESLIGLLMNAAVFVTLYAAIPLTSAGALEPLYLSVLALGTMAAFEAVLPLPAAALHLQENLRAAERLFEITDAKPPSAELDGKSPQLTRFDIEFQNVSFCYEQGRPILQNFDLKIEQGDRLLITGRSGIGKTTVAYLLRRFWDVQSGAVKIGGINIRRFSHQDLAHIVGLAPQQPHLFNGTFIDNIRMGSPDASDNEIEVACKKANIDHLFRSSQDNDAWIGEQGFLLSGGERQRAAIARALLMDTPILIFDEPTAKLDSSNAIEIFKTIDNLDHSKTIIVISHFAFAADGWKTVKFPLQ